MFCEILSILKIDILTPTSIDLPAVNLALLRYAQLGSIVTEGSILLGAVN